MEVGYSFAFYNQPTNQPTTEVIIIMDNLKKTVGTFSNLYRDTYARRHHTKALEMLAGRTTYLDPSHVAEHKTRVVYEQVLKEGMFYLIVTTEEMHDGKRGINWLVFDTLGRVIVRGKRVPNQTTAATVAEANRWIDEHLTEKFIVNHYLQAAQTKLYHISQEHLLIQQAAAVLGQLDANNLMNNTKD